MKYFLYARKSTEDEERQVMSIEAQITELKQFAARENIKIAKTFIESKSAKQPGRVEFNKMLEQIYSTNEKIGILAWHPDRLARNSVDGGQIIYLIDISKIGALKFPTFWFEPTPQGLFMLQVAFGQSKYYSDNLSENVKRGLRQKLRRGEWLTLAPTGYINNPKTRNIDPDPVKSKVIVQLFKEFANRKHSLESARHRLSFLGIVSRSSKPLGKSAVQGILTNPVYTGRIVYKGESYQGNFEPLISAKLFDKVQQVLKDQSRPRKSRHKHDFPFTGLWTCGECSAAFTAQYAKKKYVYYRCTKKKGPCNQPYISSTKMENQIQEALQKVSLPKAWGKSLWAQLDKWEVEEQSNRAKHIQQLEQGIAECQNKLDKLISSFLDGIVEKDSYIKKKDELIQQKIELEEKLRMSSNKVWTWLEPTREFLEAAHNARKLADEKDFAAQKSFLEKMGTNRLCRAGKILVTWKEPFSILLKYKGLQHENTPLQVSKKQGLSRKNLPSPMLSG